MSNKFLYQEMSRVEVEQAIKANRTLIFVGTAIEQHGPHLPVSVDVVLPMELSRRVAVEIDGVVAPPTNYGYKSLLRSGGGPQFIGTISMKGTTYISLIEDIMSAFIMQGWKRILVIDWHFENTPFLFEGIDEAVRKLNSPCLKVVKIDKLGEMTFNKYPKLEYDLFQNTFPGWAAEHAAVNETSMMMCSHNDLVSRANFESGRLPDPWDYEVIPVPDNAAPKSGVLWNWDPTQATPEKGESLYQAFTDVIVSVAVKEFGVKIIKEM